jgi:hypothetical protein
MEDEEEVIMALVDSLPRVAKCIGGTEHSPVILESMEMLFMVDNETIVKKVKDAVKTIFQANKEVLKSKLIEVIENLWKTEEQTARDMCLFFYKMMLDDLTDDEKIQIIKYISSKFKKEQITLRSGILETLSNQQSAKAISACNFMKQLGDDVKTNVGNNNYMSVVKNLLVELLKADDPELNLKIFAIIREVDKSNVRPFFKPSVILPVWDALKNKTEEDGDLYDANLIWRKLVDLQVEKDKDENTDPKESRIRKELDIFETLLEHMDVDKLDDQFFTVLEDILFKDEFFLNLYLNFYWKLEEMATKQGEKNSKLQAVMKSVSLTKIKQKAECLEKISPGLKLVLKDFKASRLVEDQDSFLEQLIDLISSIENWRDRLELVDTLLELARSKRAPVGKLKKHYTKLMFDNAFDTRSHAIRRFIELLDIEGKTGSIDTDYITILDAALGQKSCYKRSAAITIVEVTRNYKEPVQA